MKKGSERDSWNIRKKSTTRPPEALTHVEVSEFLGKFRQQAYSGVGSVAGQV